MTAFFSRKVAKSQSRKVVRTWVARSKSRMGPKGWRRQDELKTFGFGSRHEFARFVGVAKGSCGEGRSMYYPAEDLKKVKSHVAESQFNKAK